MDDRTPPQPREACKQCPLNADGTCVHHGPLAAVGKWWLRFIGAALTLLTVVAVPATVGALVYMSKLRAAVAVVQAQGMEQRRDLQNVDARISQSLAEHSKAMLDHLVGHQHNVPTYQERPAMLHGIPVRPEPHTQDQDRRVDMREGQ
jgi:hypothetical protein